jgi:hypothetical protein
MDESSKARPDKENEEMFRRLTGSSAEDESPEEIAARRDRFQQGEETLFDVLEALPDAMQRAQKHYLGMYGLKPPFSEEEELHEEAMFELMSDEQRELWHRPLDAYSKRDLPIRDENARENNLEAFAATNPPEVLRRHIWRLQRGQDEPLFGRVAPRAPKLVREYKATIHIALCDACTEELKQETEDAGAERPPYGKRERKFYDREGPLAGFYLFRYGEMFVEQSMPGFFSTFPRRDAQQCARCGVTDVELWRERFGDAD